MNIKQYLIISFGAIMAAAVVVCSIIFYSAVTVRWQNERVRLANSQLMILKDIHSNLNRLLKEVTDYILIGEESEFREFVTHRANLNDSLARFTGVTETEIGFVEEDEKKQETAEREIAARLKANIGQVLGIADQIIALAKAGDRKTAQDLLEHRLETVYDEGLAHVIEDQVRDEASEIRAGGHKLISFTYKLQYITLALLVVMLVVIAVVAEFVLRAIHRPIADLIPAIRAIGKGDFDVAIVTESKNEIGALAVSLRKMVEELRQTQSQLVQAAKLASIGQLAAGVAHELNTPLMVIRMNAQMLLRKLQRTPKEPEDLAQSITAIERNTTRMKGIIDHLRTFSRRSEREPQPVDLNRVIQDAFTMVGEQLKLHNIAVTNVLTPGLPKIPGVHNELEQVFVNFINNSKDALRECDSKLEKRIEIASGVNDTARQIEVTVRDNGGGLTTADRDKIFDPFYTTKPAGKGTGLGLSIAYGIVRQHKGEIKLVAAGPEGTEFRITFPLKEP